MYKLYVYLFFICSDMDDKFTAITIRDILMLNEMLEENMAIMSVENVELRWFAVTLKILDRFAARIVIGQVYA